MRDMGSKVRAVVQRVASAAVEVEKRVIASIDKGLLAYLGVGRTDTDHDAKYVADKIAGLRIFENDQGKMMLSVAEVAGALLIVPQFTLFGDVRRGRRPSFDDAAPPDQGLRLYEMAVDVLREQGFAVHTGEFRAMMHVKADVWGPVTILIDSKRIF